jgi:hypothetical protein
LVSLDQDNAYPLNPKPDRYRTRKIVQLRHPLAWVGNHLEGTNQNKTKQFVPNKINKIVRARCCSSTREDNVNVHCFRIHIPPHLFSEHNFRMIPLQQVEDLSA